MQLKPPKREQEPGDLAGMEEMLVKRGTDLVVWGNLAKFAVQYLRYSLYA